MQRKKVDFAEEKNKTYYMVTWDFAYRNARKNNWQQQYLDNLRFKDRIGKCRDIIGKVLNINHRNQIYEKRFKDFQYNASLK
jgi:hypothetical protein